nr:DNA polymerase I [uncultured bacterium]
MKKLFLLDSMALIYRAHFAFINNPRQTSKGLDTSAVLGFINVLLEILKKEKPTHIAAAFDLSAPTFRHIEYTAYKANRPTQPEGITAGIPYIKMLLKAMNIPILQLEGYEADDVIGTIAKKLSAPDLEIYMMTSDKDYCQLLEENRIFMFRPASKFSPNEVWGVSKALEKFGIKRVEQVIDMLGLQGDAVDNIPGLPGVGEKTAQKLLEEYDNIENIIANVQNLKGKLKESVELHSDKALLSKKLATIDINVPLVFSLDDFLLQEPNKEDLSDLLDELEFKTIKTRILGASEEEKAAKKPTKKAPATGQMDMFGNVSTPNTTQNTTLSDDTETTSTYHIDNINTKLHQYHLIDTPEKRQSLIQFLENQTEFCFDTETTSLVAIEAELVGLALSYYAGEAYYVPFPADKAQTQAILEEFRGVLESENIKKIGQNLKYDITVLKKYNIEIKGECFDTMLASYLLDPDNRHSMDAMAEKYLNYSPVKIDTLIGKKSTKNTTQGNMRDVEVQKVVEYAGEDADITLQLKEYFAPKVAERPILEKLFKTVEMPLMHVLAHIEATGVRIDTQALAESSEILDKDIKILEQTIYTLSGEVFNIASPQQLGKVLFEKLNLMKNPPKTKTGQYATGEEVLTKLTDNEIVQQILEIRELQKLKSTYVDALPALVSKIDGRLHTSYNQAVVATGRLSSTNPNLQNIPIKTAKGREIRKAFIPTDDDFVILSADYSQIELRLIAAFSQDETMMEAFNNGTDIHTATASKIYKIDIQEVTADMRRMAKTANFAILYGSSAFNLSAQLKISTSEAKKLIDSYYGEFSAVKKFKDEMIQKARQFEYAETFLGRRRYLAGINGGAMVSGQAERNAVNSPIQGTAADMIKLAMIDIHRFMMREKMQSKMILQVHDELVFDAHKSEIDFLKENVIKLMENALLLPVRIGVEAGVGKNWLEAH